MSLFKYLVYICIPVQKILSRKDVLKSTRILIVQLMTKSKFHEYDCWDPLEREIYLRSITIMYTWPTNACSCVEQPSGSYI